MNILTDAQYFSKNDPSKPDVTFLKDHFYGEGRISEDYTVWIFEKATAILRAERPPGRCLHHAPLANRPIYRNPMNSHHPASSVGSEDHTIFTPERAANKEGEYSEYS